LLTATLSNNEDAVELLLERGALLNATDRVSFPLISDTEVKPILLCFTGWFHRTDVRGDQL